MKWIPMSERLPENGHYYLWCSDMGSVQSDYYWDGFEKEQKYGYNIVAWMPLPRPYTADRKTEPSVSEKSTGSEKPNNCEDWQDWKDRMWAEAVVTEQTELKGSKRLVKGYLVKTPHKSRDSHEIAKTEPQTERSE